MGSQRVGLDLATEQLHLTPDSGCWITPHFSVFLDDPSGPCVMLQSTAVCSGLPAARWLPRVWFPTAVLWRNLPSSHPATPSGSIWRQMLLILPLSQVWKESYEPSSCSCMAGKSGKFITKASYKMRCWDSVHEYAGDCFNLSFIHGKIEEAEYAWSAWPNSCSRQKSWGGTQPAWCSTHGPAAMPSPRSC